MNNTDLDQLTDIAKAISRAKLTLNGNIMGKFGSYEIVSYVDEIVVLDDLDKEVISVEREAETQDD